MQALIDMGRRLAEIMQVYVGEDNSVKVRVKYYDARDGGFIENRWVDVQEVQLTPKLARAIADKAGLKDAQAQGLAESILEALKSKAIERLTHSKERENVNH